MPIHIKQSGMIPFFNRKLCDERFRQMVVIILGFQHLKHIKRVKYRNSVFKSNGFILS